MILQPASEVQPETNTNLATTTTTTGIRPSPLKLNIANNRPPTSPYRRCTTLNLEPLQTPRTEAKKPPQSIPNPPS